MNTNVTTPAPKSSVDSVSSYLAEQNGTYLNNTNLACSMTADLDASAVKTAFDNFVSGGGSGKQIQFIQVLQQIAPVPGNSFLYTLLIFYKP